MKRIHRLLYPKTSGGWAPLLAVMILVLTVTATVAAWPAKPSQSNAVAEQAETESPRGPAYSKWLNEDVVYIIDQAERTAFLRLTNDEERDKFIEEFWERRNPTPGAPNKFKEEHYRRIAYANRHFSSGVPGWQTDRGHIYILYGPPDELEVHPHAAVPTELWLYRHVEGVGDNATITFVDRTGQGDFRLSPGAPLVPVSNGTGSGVGIGSGSGGGAGSRGGISSGGAGRTGEGVFRIGGVVSAPKAIFAPNPEYSEEARQAQYQGTVVLSLIVGADGVPRDIKVARRVGLGLDEKAVETVKTWKFEPGMKDGKPVATYATIEIAFHWYGAPR